jgi:ABC-2 type transport system permease protein
MRPAANLAWLELKLFLREPLTVVFSLALPLVMLFVLGGVFGNEPSEPGEMLVYRGQGPMDYYVPAYFALVLASVSIISIPTHLAGNRERGVLRRFHASSVSPLAVVGSQVAVTIVLSIASAIALAVAATIAYDYQAPGSVVAVVGAFLFLGVMFSALGILLGALLPTARSAQALGMMLWFVMLMLGGAGPPPEVMTGAMSVVRNLTPLWHGVRVMQDAWLGLDPGLSWLIAVGILVVAAGVGVRWFRWE